MHPAYFYAMKFFCVSVFSLLTLGLWAQSHDTLKVMAYNLTYYGETTSFCTSSNNPIADKDVHFEIVAKHADPDILVVNEMGASTVYANRILSKVLNTDGVNKYEYAPLQNNSFSDLVNGVFYNKKKFAYVSQHKVTKTLVNSNIVRAIDVVRFYYKDENLDAESDTVFLDIAGAHLKAGSNSSDETDRELAAEALMDYLSTTAQPTYAILCGDMNLKNSNEGAFKEFVSSDYGDQRFYDPVDKLGGWNNNAAFSDYHTQSTRTSSTNGGCFSGGGLDDRFDLILMTGGVIQDTGAVSYVDGSYTTLGQDGNHFNSYVNQPPNNSAPATVISALYELSDHLPVTADIRIRLVPENDTSDSSISISKVQKPQSKAWLQQGELRVESYHEQAGLRVMNLYGELVGEYRLTQGLNTFPVSHMPSGAYLLVTTTPKGYSAQKVIIVH